MLEYEKYSVKVMIYPARTTDMAKSFLTPKLNHFYHIINSYSQSSKTQIPKYTKNIHDLLHSRFISWLVDIDGKNLQQSLSIFP